MLPQSKFQAAQLLIEEFEANRRQLKSLQEWEKILLAALAEVRSMCLQNQGHSFVGGVCRWCGFIENTILTTTLAVGSKTDG